MNAKIGAAVYKVVESQLDNNLYGRIHYDTDIIDIEKTLGKHQKKVTLMHEMIHAMLFQQGIAKHDERNVDAFAHQLVALIMDNPKLMQYIQER